MSYETYKVMHLAGLLLLFSAFGAAFLGRKTEAGKAPRAAMILHGIGMLVMLVAGFGLLARNGIHWPWPGWVIAKLGVWVALGALPVVVSKKLLPAGIAWVLGVALGACAAWLAVTRPWE